MVQWTKSLLFCLVLPAVVVACNNSGSRSSSIVTNTDQSLLAASTPYVRTGVNGSSRGEIWSAAAGTRLNLDSGEIKYVSEGRVYPSLDGREYAELINNFQFYPFRGCGGAPISSHAVFIRDTATDTVQNPIEVLARLAGPVLLSPDGNTLALFATGDDVCGDLTQYFATLMTRDGRVITQGSERVVGFDWMPDNRLAFMVRETSGYKLVVESEVNTFSGVVTADLSELEGFASRFRVSPDGKQILIEVVTQLPPALAVLEYREATVWQANIDGTNLRKVVDTSRTSSVNNAEFAEPLVNQPVWSPDGSTMLVTENYSLGASTVFYGSETENLTYIDSLSIRPVNQENVTYLMPSNADFQRLPPARYDQNGVRPLFAADEQGRNNVLGINPIGRQVWTPAVAAPAYTGGAFPAPNGQVNRGLVGSLYAYTSVVNASAVVGAPLTSIDLKTDSLSVTGLNTANSTISAFDVSPDKERIVALHPVSSNNGLVNLYSAGGLLLQSYSQVTGNYDYTAIGSVKMSPANTSDVAWLFRSSAGDQQGVAVLNMRTGVFVDVLDAHEYDSFAYLANGDLLLVSANQVFLARRNLSGYAAPSLLFQHSEYLVDVVAHPNENRMAFSSLGRIFTIDTDGGNLTRVTAPSRYFYAFPAWSPDGKALLFRGADASGASSSSTFIVSATASNVTLYGDFLQNNIMQLSESSTQQHRIADPIIWR